MSNQVDIVLRASGQGETAAAFLQVRNGLDQLRSAAGFAQNVVSGAVGRLASEGILALRRFASEGLRAAENMKEAAEKTGMSAEGYQKLSYAASMTGSSMGAVDVALRTLQVGISEGDKELSKLGLNLAELARSSPDEQFRKVAEAIAKIPSQADRTRAAMQAFGRSGQELLPMIDGLRTLSDEAERLGIVLDQKALAAAERFNETIKKLQLQAQSKIVLAVEYTQRAMDGTDPLARAEVQGKGLAAAGGALIGGIYGGVRGAQAGALVAGTVAHYGQKAAQYLTGRRYGTSAAELDEANTRAADVEQQKKDADARAAAEAASRTNPELDKLEAQWRAEGEDVKKYLETLRREAIVARDAGTDAAEALRAAWAAATGEAQVPDAPVGKEQVSVAHDRFARKGGMGVSSDLGDWKLGAEIMRKRAQQIMQAAEKAAEDEESSRKEAAEKAAAARKELGRLDLDAIRQTALDKAQAIEDAAEKEAAALDRAADTLATRAKDAKTKADAAWENLLGGKHADGKTDADDAADRRKAADSKRLERRAKTVIARMEEGQSVTAEGKEIAAAYVERERAKWLAGGAKGAREGADAAAKRREAAGKAGKGLQKSFEDQDHATDRAAIVAEIGGDLPAARPPGPPSVRSALQPTRRSGAPAPARGIAAADHATDRGALVAEIMGVPAPEPQRRRGHDPRAVAPVVSDSVLNASRTQYPAIAAMPAAGLAGGAVVAELKTSNRLLALIAKSGGVE